VTTLSAWTFGTYDGASHAATVLRDLVNRGRVRVTEAAVVRWRASARAPLMTSVAARSETRQPALLDLVVGVTYAVPLLQAAVGEVHVDEGSSLSSIGVDETFTNKLRDRVVPGTSALLVLSDDAAVEWLRTGLDQPDHPQFVSTGVEHDLDREADPEAAAPTNTSSNGPEEFVKTLFA
jgi:uncharacterized membrane protein